jgi:AcrR family transcriptional regulator
MASAVRKAGGVRGTVTREAISVAALAQIDERGAAAFTMRQLAIDLGVTNMAPYWHARNRQEVLDWVVELVLESVPPVSPAEGEWDEKIEERLVGARAKVLEHPNVIDLLGQGEHYIPAFARNSNEIILLLGEGGFAGEDRVFAFATLMTHFYGSLLVARLHRGFPRPYDQRMSDEASRWIPPDRVDPNIFEELNRFDMPEQEQFRVAIRTLLAGLVARASI